MILKPGTRILHKSGRFGNVVSRISAHSGYRVRFDQRANEFEPDEPRIPANDLTPVDPELHNQWEAAWPPFVRKERKWANPPEDEFDVNAYMDGSGPYGDGYRGFNWS